MTDFMLWLTNPGTNETLKQFFWNNIYIFMGLGVYLTMKYPKFFQKLIATVKKFRVKMI